MGGGGGGLIFGVLRYVSVLGGMSMRLSGHLRKANNIVPFCLSPDQGN